MKEDAAAKGPKPLGGRILPLVVFFCLLLGLGAVLFALWKRETQNSPPPPAAAANEEIESLRRQKAELEERLRDEPCVLRRSLGPPQGPAAADQAAPGGPAAAAPSPGPQESKYESVDRIEDATVFIISAAGGDVSIGTGFFVAPDMVLSNAHVVGDASARVLVINRKLAAPVEASIVSVRRGRGSGGADYALFRVPKQYAIQPLDLRDTPRRTEKVNAWGYPHAISRNDPKFQALMRGELTIAPELVFSDGVVSAVLERTPPLIVHTAPLSQGNSGGPLTDEKGLVVGINTLITLDEESYRQTSIALPASDFITFLQQNGIAVTLVKP